MDSRSPSEDEESLLTKAKPYIIGASQIVGWIYNMAALSVMVHLGGSMFTDTFSSCSYGIALLYKPCLIQSFGFLNDVNAFNARVQSCSDPEAGRICIADFELSAVGQQCTVGSQVCQNVKGRSSRNV